jgi:excisionase family DNA binding protein
MDSNYARIKDVNEDKKTDVARNNVHCEPLLNIDQTAEILNISPYTVRAMVKIRIITFVRIGSDVLFRHQDLIDFVESNLVRSQSISQGTAS